MLGPNELRRMDFGFWQRFYPGFFAREGARGVPDVAEFGNLEATTISTLSARVQNLPRCARIAGGGAREFTACPYFSVPGLV